MADTEKAPQPQPQPQQQQDPTSQPQQPKAAKQKQVIAEKVSGTVKWFNVKSGYGFINRNDTKEDVFVHQTAIARNNPRKAVRSVGDGEAVEFAVVAGEKGHEASGVTGPGGEPVKGSPYAADKRRGFHRQYYPRQSGGRGGEGAPRRGGLGRRGPPPTQGAPKGTRDRREAVHRLSVGAAWTGAAGGAGQGPRQNGQEGEAPAAPSSPQPQVLPAKPKPNKPAGTTIETTTNESQA
ncbi:hypothetical protein MSG28_003858 [Choristoneura fumiferana]|uniref:Uncharacterized protein n=1 Tax=Choristoneura fumiferana TaxID=7141 RepID=A0ACC0KGB9_CHOFU|nr:hypothetical protein MSG28_003858 [Choristoneura fumiferana]